MRAPVSYRQRKPDADDTSLSFIFVLYHLSCFFVESIVLGWLLTHTSRCREQPSQRSRLLWAGSEHGYDVSGPEFCLSQSALSFVYSLIVKIPFTLLG
jgi:hypothetical protein